MRCGPGVGLSPDPEGSVLVCPCCGWERGVFLRPLHVVTGPSGAGKTTVAEVLTDLLPDCEVFDVDVILHVAALGWDVWRNTWLQLAHAIAACGRSTVLVGSIRGDQLEPLPARCLVGPIRCCLLDSPDAVLASRLRSRPSWRGFTQDKIDGELRYATWLRDRIQPAFDTHDADVRTVAGRVAACVRQWEAA
jgi:energy-coupling factor transporter ATP-binding protein EcfA2